MDLVLDNIEIFQIKYILCVRVLKSTLKFIMFTFVNF